MSLFFRSTFRSPAPGQCLLFVLCVGCGLMSAGCGGNFSDLESLPVTNYVQKPGDFMGNTYVVRAQIDSQIKWDKAVGRILAVLPEEASVRLPVFVPQSVPENLHIGQRYEMRVRIEEGGVLYVEDLRKY